MSRYLCHDHPDVFEFTATVLRSRPGGMLLSRSYFYPGGGGQLPDRGHFTIDGAMHAISGVEESGSVWWHLHDGPDHVAGEVTVRIDAGFRASMAQLHTALHLVNAFVFKAFEGALVTGVQMGADRTARIDFDLPDADNDRIRALEPLINDAIRAGLKVRETFVPLSAAASEPGLLRSRSVAPPPQADGTVRIIEIDGLDRQACGGTHLGMTSDSPPIRILKIENKGRHNRRVRIGLA
ncbi:alanyl-tRNA editing protein [Hydrogenophaga sp.]|jgi:misacylated tRNA(Ala) deacylase|uniref:alanyl-tRNA editing protein n=1 Tax=Hydrogenophaga sp. TaxID=1904254 RepID=UPI003F72312B